MNAFGVNCRSVRAAGCLVLLLSASWASANDSSATLGAGGLMLTESDDIVLDVEDLYVSSEEIRVRYEFRNVADGDVTTRVAFPLPDIDLAALAEVPIDRPGDDAVNFVDFTVTVDGKQVRPALDMRAWHKGLDLTGELRSMRLELSLFEEGFHEALLDLDAAQRQMLTDRELAFYDDYGNVHAQWLLRTAFHWEQTFPAGRSTVIEHRYRPVVGQSFVSKHLLDEPYLQAFCIDEATGKAIARRLAQHAAADGEGALLVAYQVDYILTTANNWRGPIGRFHLTIDKRDPKRLLTLCLDGLEKSGETTFEAEFTGYVPKRDLRILILE